MRIALLLLSLFVCWQIAAAGLIKEPTKGDKDDDDCKEDKHSENCCDDKEPEGKEKEEWKMKKGHPSDHLHHDHDKGKLSGLGHLVDKLPLVHDLAGGKGLGGILHSASGKNGLIDHKGWKKSHPLTGVLPGEMIGEMLGSKGGKGLLHLRGTTKHLPLGHILPLKGIHDDSDCDDDEKEKKMHGMKRKRLTDDWHEKHGKHEHDWKHSDGKCKDWSGEKNKGKNDAWKLNDDKEGKHKGGWNREEKSHNVHISTSLKDKKDSAHWENLRKSKKGKKGHSWDHDHVKKETPCDEDVE